MLKRILLKTKGENNKIRFVVTEDGEPVFHGIYDNDNIYIWNTSAKSLPEGKRYKVRGTVKDLSFYKGQNKFSFLKKLINKIVTFYFC